MMLHQPDSPFKHNRPRSNSHPVRPQQVRRSSETSESAPVRPPRNPARPSTFGGGQRGPPPVAFKPTTASEDDHREREIVCDRDSPSVNVPPPKSPVNKKQPAQTTPPPQINTLDRKILLELKRSMLARSAQFALKNNTKHHPFPPDEVPYPRSYDHKCIDTDVWENVFCEQLCGNVAFHTFDVPPTKVLDLGCGSGSWIMACARRWKRCHFVGLDIVPLHPDLGQSELSKRVNWVQANFLEPLPFQDEEFDFVHIKRIARGVPEYRWNALFDEIVRVMKPGAVLEILEEDLYIPGQLMETANNDSPSSSHSSPYSLEELSQPWIPSPPGPSTSLPDVSTESYCSSQVIRRSTSERTKRLSSTSRTSSNARPPPLPTRSTPPSPENVRPFPLLKPSNRTARPMANHFNLQNLLPKRPSRDSRAGTDGERSRKTKKEPPVPMPLNIGLHPPSVSGSPVTPNQEHSTKKILGPVSSSGGLPSPELHSSATGSSSDLVLGPNTNTNAVPMPTQTLHKFGEGDPSLTLPLVENTSGKLEVDFPQYGQSGDPMRARTRSFSCSTSENDGQRRSTASREFGPFGLNTVGMHGHVKQVRPSNVQSSPNSGVLADVEPIESNRRDRKLIVILPAPPPKDIPERSKPQSMPSSSPSSNISNPMTGLSRSVPDRFTDHRDRNRDQLLSPTLGSSKSIKSMSTSSLAISTSRSTGRVPPSQQNGHSSDNSGPGDTVNSPSTEIPPNPRQHKLLEVIYAEMHAARFVNLAPLNLLENHIRTYFKNVRAHAPLMFAFPPPPGCEHRPEFDAADSQQGKLNLTQRAEDNDDQDRYLEPDIPLSIHLFPLPPTTPHLGSPKSIPPRLTRERSLSVASNEPGPSRPRSSSTKSSRRSIAGPGTSNHRRPRSSKFLAGHGDGTVSGRVIMTGDELLTGTSEYVAVDASVIEGFGPTRVPRAAKKSTSSASDELERSMQRINSLFTRSSDAKGKCEGGEARKRSHASVPKLTRHSSTTGSLPPASLSEYKTQNAISSISLSPSVVSSSSSTIIQSDLGKGKRGLTAADRAQLNALHLSNKKAEIDIRSLNLHLRVRVLEILGCSEAMWDWVKEFQHRESEKERKRKEQLALAAKTVQGVGGGRVSYYHHDRVKRERQNSAGSDPSILNRKRSTRSFATSTTRRRRDDGDSTASGYVAGSPTSSFATSFGSTKGDDPSDHLEKSVKQELLHMTRGRFDEVLSWFQFDMDDSIRLTHSMATKTPSSSFTTDPSEQRKSFDEACQKFESYLQQQPQRSTSLVKPNDTVSETSGKSPRLYGQQHEGELCCLPPLLNQVHPSKRLCRTIRVWVAWKS